MGEIAASSYQAFISQFPTVSVYHTLEWQRVIQYTYGYVPRYVTDEKAGRITGLLPLFEVSSFISGRHLVAIPFSQHVTALYENEIVLWSLVDQAQQVASQYGDKYIEVRGSASALSKMGFQILVNNWISQLDLTVSEETLWNNLHSSTRRNIRKARKNNLIVRRGLDVADFAAFYQLILETRRYQGAIPYPARLFTALQNMPHTKLYLICYQEHILAGVIIFCYGNYVLYAYGASVKNQKVLRMRPNDFLFWHIITEMQGMGYETFDFGTTPVGNKNLLRFKENWGAETKSLAYAYWLNKSQHLPVIRRDSRKVKLVSAIIRKMPLWVLRVMGERLFKHLA